MAGHMFDVSWVQVHVQRLGLPCNETLITP
jgi:hypothetical protein